ncbi:MAG: LysR substrate-binding domain-containing protein [Pigmentiphaga sp.]|uniref:LysR family transcriptional regulator n=1 Tax=Pigmentiphaga sp. TaxID=1977564 RepID=UPI0029B02B93|nr:LysR substrate-binding domain-containing protein [Pigmentiphaga sp.]MDX3905330.1 LysR substrate-binding domain-containing protein [Pigmentiphaga sp.]
MDLRRLRYFVTILETGSFSQAAEKLHVVQSALSAQIQKLEESLGTRLFVRDAHGVRPTASGRKLHGHARRILDMVAAAERDIKQDAAHGGAIVRIGIPSSISRMMAVPLLQAVETVHADITLQVVEAMTDELEVLLSQRKLEMAILFAVGDTASDYATDFLRDEPLYLVSPPGQRHAAPRPVPFADLAGFDLVLPTLRHRVRQMLSREAARRGLSLRIKHELDSMAQTVQLIASGNGHSVMIVSSFIDEWMAGRVHAAPLSDLYTTARVVLATAHGAASAPVDAIRELIVATVARLARHGTWPDRPAALLPSTARLVSGQ